MLFFANIDVFLSGIYPRKYVVDGGKLVPCSVFQANAPTVSVPLFYIPRDDLWQLTNIERSGTGGYDDMSQG